MAGRLRPARVPAERDRRRAATRRVRPHGAGGYAASVDAARRLRGRADRAARDAARAPRAYAGAMVGADPPQLRRGVPARGRRELSPVEVDHVLPAAVRGADLHGRLHGARSTSRSPTGFGAPSPPRAWRSARWPPRSSPSAGSRTRRRARCGTRRRLGTRRSCSSTSALSNLADQPAARSKWHAINVDVAPYWDTMWAAYFLRDHQLTAAVGLATTPRHRPRPPWTLTPRDEAPAGRPAPAQPAVPARAAVNLRPDRLPRSRRRAQRSGGLDRRSRPTAPRTCGWRPAPSDGVRALRDAGFALVVVSNQPAAAKGTATLEELEAVSARVRELLGVEFDGWYACLHHPDGVVPGLAGPCDCRKPAPGMLLEAARELELDLAASWIVGDTDADVGAGRAAGTRTVLVEHPGSAHRRTGRGRARPHGRRPRRSRSGHPEPPLGWHAVIDRISTRIFADGADLDGILRLAADPRISGFTTNPTLMWKAGLTDYAEFAERLLERITEHPISFEVFADDEAEMRRQARSDRRLGRERLRQDPGHDDQRRVDGAARARAVRGRRAGQRHRAVHHRAGRADHRGGRRRRAELHLGLRRPDRRRRASTRCRSCASRSRSCAAAPRVGAASGPARARCSTSSRPTRSAATSSR